MKYIDIYTYLYTVYTSYMHTYTFIYTIHTNTGTFTISNLGMYGVTQFDALLPPGTGAILSIAAAQPKVTLNKNGQFGVQKVMTVTISCDHRHIYGSHAAEFLKDLAGKLYYIGFYFICTIYLLGFILSILCISWVLSNLVL